MGAFIELVNRIEDVGLERLEFAYVKNFKSLVPKGSVAVGDVVIFIEPDSVLPDAEWAATFKKYAPKRVKPIKLAGFLTEGIIIPFEDLFPDESPEEFSLGGDVSERLGIIKYEPPLPHEQGSVGQLPYWLPKTDEIRWEHLPLEVIVGPDRRVTLKIDGSSTTYVVLREEVEDDIIHIYSRSLEYADDFTSGYSRVLQNELPCGVALRVELLDEAFKIFESDETIDAVVFRGELYGNNIQKRGKNPHAAESLSWRMFHVYAYTMGLLEELPWNGLFCNNQSHDAVLVPHQTLNVDENFITGVQDGAALTFAPEMYEGVVINFPPYYYKGRLVSSCKVINKVYDAAI